MNPFSNIIQDQDFVEKEGSFLRDVTEKLWLFDSGKAGDWGDTFATHSLKQGVDLRYIQTLLGHEFSRTTEIFTYVSNATLRKIESLASRIVSDNQVDSSDFGDWKNSGYKRHCRL